MVIVPIRTANMAQPQFLTKKSKNVQIALFEFRFQISHLLNSTKFYLEQFGISETLLVRL